MMLPATLVLLVGALCPVKSEKVAKITHITKSQIKEIGDTVEFSCEFQYTLSHWDQMISWYKKDSGNRTREQLTVDDDIQYNSLDANRISARCVDYPISSSWTCTMQLRNLKYSDAGTYECVVARFETDGDDFKFYEVQSLELTVQKSTALSYEESKRQVKSIGESVEFVCDFEDAVGYPVNWLKVNEYGNKQLVASHVFGIFLVEDGKYFLKSHRPNFYSFLIRNIQEADAGTYECQVQTSANSSVSKEVKLIIPKPLPVITYISERQIQNVGEVVELVCNVNYSEGHPVIWFKINKNKTEQLVSSYTFHRFLVVKDIKYSFRSDRPNSYTLQINNIEETDTGVYECRVQISANSSVSKEVELIVRKPPPIISYISEKQIQRIGETVEFVCDVTNAAGHPVTWFRLNECKTERIIATRTFHNLLVVDSRKYSLRSDRSNSYTLQVRDVREDDAGTYGCRIETYDNSYGNILSNREVELEIGSLLENTRVHRK